MPKVYKQLYDTTKKLEKHYRDIQDFEFTIEKNKLFMLQTRTGKRTAAAAVKIAIDLVAEKLITKEGSAGLARCGFGPGGFHGGPRRGMEE
jgi:pyruvate,orthophosphate dikinase